MKTVDMDIIRELAKDAIDNEPTTGVKWVDALYDSQIGMVGHTQPYYALFAMIAKELEPNLVVELGSWRAIAAAHFAVNSYRVLTIDIHREDKDAQQAAIQVASRLPNLEYINGWTWDDWVVERVRQESPIDILYIDAWHEYKYAMREWELYSPMLSDGALVIADDIMDRPGATVDMTRFWNELSLEDKWTEDRLHPGVPMGFGIWTG